MKTIRKTVIAILTITAFPLSVPRPQAAQLSVHLEDQTGPTIDGLVDTVSDTFTINSWTCPSLAPVWTPALTQIPLTLRAYSFNGGNPYDVPNNWDGTISGWAFLLQPPQDNHSIQWQQGYPTGGVASFGWGGFRGYNNVVGSVGVGGNKTFQYLPYATSGVRDISLETVSITPIPEPSAGLLAVAGLGAAYFFHKKS